MEGMEPRWHRNSCNSYTNEEGPEIRQFLAAKFRNIATFPSDNGLYSMMTAKPKIQTSFHLFFYF